jgi:hypothetical protein
MTLSVGKDLSWPIPIFSSGSGGGAAVRYKTAPELGQREPLAASAVLAAAAAAATTTLAAMAALTGLRCRSFMRRRREIRCTVAPCTVGGGPAGHNAASNSAASLRCERPRSCQPRP